jgi:hypothetical protein
LSLAYGIVDCRCYLSISVFFLPNLVTQPTYSSLFSITLHRYDTKPFVFRIRCTPHLQSHSLVPNISAPTYRQIPSPMTWMTIIIDCILPPPQYKRPLSLVGWRDTPIAHQGSDEQSSVLTMASSGALDHDLSQIDGEEVTIACFSRAN